MDLRSKQLNNQRDSARIRDHVAEDLLFHDTVPSLAIRFAVSFEELRHQLVPGLDQTPHRIGIQDVRNNEETFLVEGLALLSSEFDKFHCTDPLGVFATTSNVADRHFARSFETTSLSR